MRHSTPKNLPHALEIIAHRGASHEAPENTRAALLLACQQEADGIEIDIHLTRDGEIVVMHDDNTFRTTGQEIEIATLTRSQRNQLDAGSWKGPQFAGEPVPTLDEMLTLLPPDKRLFIEIKGAQVSDIFAPLKQSLERAGIGASQIAVIGFDYQLMRSFKAFMPAVQVSWLRDGDGLKELGNKSFFAQLDETIRFCHAARLDGLNLSLDWLEEEMVFERVRNSLLRLEVHTINDGADARRLAAAGVDGITTDRPAYLRAELAKHAWLDLK